MSLPALSLILGGARSGKSARAEQLIEQAGGGVYFATAQAFDGEMEHRITQHKARRESGLWTTYEEPLDLVGGLQSLHPHGKPVLVDCLTLWTTNLMMAERDVQGEFDRLGAALPHITIPIIFVSNEVGLGIVPDNALSRAFRDHAGRLHQQVAALADRVEFMVAGLPMTVKDTAT